MIDTGVVSRRDLLSGPPTHQGRPTGSGWTKSETTAESSRTSFPVTSANRRSRRKKKNYSTKAAATRSCATSRPNDRCGSGDPTLHPSTVLW